MDGRHARAVLGVPEHASADDIRRAFRQRALVTHPDRGGDRTAFELAVLAFETLQHVTVSTPVARRANPFAPMTTPAATPAARPRFSMYDCTRVTPVRQFADVLRVALARR
jgi:hypothetical protein